MFDPFKLWTWKLAHGRELELGTKSVLMGILNVTPDSFSDGGNLNSVEDAVRRAKTMVEEGAQIIDVGGESTRPGAKEVSASEEQDRVLPVIEALAQQSDALISIDTYRVSTAELAIKAGAHIINDVWGCQKEPEIAELAASTVAGLCAMHTGRDREKKADVIEDQLAFLSQTIEICDRSNVRDNQLILDPGFGFAKDTDENVELLARLSELHQLGRHLLIGTSRKRFIGAVTGREVDERAVGTAATSVIARLQGGAVFRVHDVKENLDALAFADQMIAQQQPSKPTIA